MTPSDAELLKAIWTLIETAAPRPDGTLPPAIVGALEALEGAAHGWSCDLASDPEEEVEQIIEAQWQRVLGEADR